MARRLFTALLAVMVLGTAVTAAVPAASAAKVVRPSKDPFYRYAKPLGHIKPGTVLKKRTVMVALSGNPTPVPADQLLYRTTNEVGRPSVTVTTVLRPSTASAVPQIVSYLSFY